MLWLLPYHLPLRLPTKEGVLTQTLTFTACLPGYSGNLLLILHLCVLSYCQFTSTHLFYSKTIYDMPFMQRNGLSSWTISSEGPGNPDMNFCRYWFWPLPAVPCHLPDHIPLHVSVLLPRVCLSPSGVCVAYSGVLVLSPVHCSAQDGTPDHPSFRHSVHFLSPNNLNVCLFFVILRWFSRIFCLSLQDYEYKEIYHSHDHVT